MREIPLTQGFIAKIDDEDYDLVANRKWHVARDISGNLYARSYCKERKTGISMHRLIMNVKDRTILVDHKDWDGLNNQKYNLRACNHSVNNRNRRPKSIPAPVELRKDVSYMPTATDEVVDKAIQELIKSMPFKVKASQDAKLRVYLGRINKGKADIMIKINLLESFGYIIDVQMPV